MTQDQKFRRLLRNLRRDHPTLLPVRVYRRGLSDHWGSCALRHKDGRPSHFVITVHTPMAWVATMNILIHEWAHARSWSEGETVCDHGPEWGLALSRIYQEQVDL